GRTGVNMAPATLARIAAVFPNVFAVKEASGSLDQVSDTLALAPKGFTVLSGDDALTVPMMALGAKGVISVLSNVLPRESAKMVAAALAGDFKAAAAWHLKLLPAMRALFVETNEPRLPLTPATAATRAALKAAWKKAGLKL
ncbi:MAG: dihydrodipicolinate synthase, partial [Elusimicrobia bacterium]